MIVQKYGGVCLETPERIKQVAQSVAALAKQERVIVVVSAMGKTTDDLVRLAYQVSPHPNRRELDMLLTTGERISISEALRRKLGIHVQQKGSLNAPDRLRFDVSQPRPITSDELHWVEAEVNARLHGSH